MGIWVFQPFEVVEVEPVDHGHADGEIQQTLPCREYHQWPDAALCSCHPVD